MKREYNISVAGYNGPGHEKVVGHVFGEWGVHKTTYEGGYKNGRRQGKKVFYVVTHIPTGMKALDFYKMAPAKDFAKRANMSAINITGKEKTKDMRCIINKFKDIFSVVRASFPQYHEISDSHVLY